MMASARLGADQIDELADSGDVGARNRSGEGVMHYGMERRDDGSVIPLWMMERWDLSPHEKNNDGDSPAELARQKGKEALAEAMEQKWREMSALEESSRIAEGVGAGFALPGMGPRRV